MAFYENQSDMFKKRAEKFKRDGDYHYAQAMSAKESGKTAMHKEHMAKSKWAYKQQELNEGKAKEHAGKKWS